MREITKTEFAKERGVHPSRVTQWLRDKRIVETASGRIDADTAHERLGKTLDQSKGIRRTGGNVTSTTPTGKDLVDQAGGDDKEPSSSGSSREGTDYWEHKARRERAEAQRSEMKAMQEAGALVAADGVRREAVATARQLRNALLAIPDRVSPVLDPANPARAHKLLTDEIGKVLREFGAGLEQRAAADRGAAEPEEALLPSVL